MKGRWTIRRKLTLGVALVVAMTAAMAAVTVFFIQENGEETASIVRKYNYLDSVQELRVAFVKLLMPGNDYLIHGHEEEKENFLQLLKNAEDRLAQADRRLRGEGGEDFIKSEARRMLEKTRAALAEIEHFASQIFALKNPIGNPEGAVFMEKMDALADSNVEDLDFIIALFSKRVEDAALNIAESRGHVRRLVEVMGLEIIFFAGLGGFFFVFMITRRLRQLAEATSRVSGGDLKTRIDVAGTDELSGLAHAFNSMTGDLRRLLEKEKELAATQAAYAIERVKSEELGRAYDDLKNAQAQLLQSEKLAGVGLLAAGVAHELNSPLAGLLSLIRTYRRGAAEGTPEAEDLKDMAEATEHMAKIVRDLNAFSRKTSEEFAEVNLSDVIESTLSFSAYFLRERNVEILKDYAPDLLNTCGNKGQLQEVVLNMVTNARDAMPDGGRFTIRTKNSSDRCHVVMEFSDTGPGIKKENLPKIFNPFFTTKGPGRGTGLGLFVSHGIIKNHNGSMTVESDEGKGARFVMTFPALTKS